KIRKTRVANALEYVFRIDLETPNIPLPVVTIKIPVP
ncbi:unnamed protein product, partial [marine sediment metagenome]